MKHLFAAIAVSLSAVSFALAQSGEINIVPKPRSVERRAGSFELNSNTRFVARGRDELVLANYFRDEIERRYGFKIKITSDPKISIDTVGRSTTRNTILLSRRRFQPPYPADEWYSLVVNTSSVYIEADGSGRFAALQTLLQLIPPTSKVRAVIPNVTILDAPRFPYRGMHLDVSRHFQPVEFVKKFIDQMAQYKFNTFHWHLTDDQGWRIEIKKYPKLTEVGSMRPETMVDRNFSPYIGDGKPHGGFYTQEQIKEVIKYAKERHITVIPEIELPGHASAAIAAYPQLGCKTDYQYKLQTTWGIFKETFCPTDETFKFLEDVLDETIKLFADSPYIHIGGDEVLKDHWKESAFVQDLMKRENLKDEHEVQSYFIRRIEKFVNSKGKKIIGWDEILDGGLAPNATVMSWRGMRGGIAAAKAKHDVIMTPTDFVYFDYGQGDPAYEPLNIGSYVPLSKVYSFEPVPPELTVEEAKYVIGGQANIWTEYIKTASHVEYMAFPRMLALSEVLWSPKESRDFADFQRRLNAVLPRLDKQGVNYRIPEPGGLQNIVTENERATITLTPAFGTRIHYTTDGTTPDERSPVYTRPIEITLAENEVKALKTVVINGAGRKSFVYAATVVRGKLREPDATDAAKPGMNYSFLVPNEDPTIKSMVENGETRSTSLNQFAQRFDLKKPFAVTFDGYFRIPEDGVYEFQVDSTWDTTVILGEKTIIDDAGTIDRKIRSAIVPLKAGLHKISLRYNHRGGDSSFRFRWGIKGRGLTQAWGGEFVH